MVLIFLFKNQEKKHFLRLKFPKTQLKNSFMSLPSTAIWEFTHFEQLNSFLSVWIFTLWTAKWFFISMNSLMLSSSAVIGWTSFHTLSSWMVFHQNEFFHVSSNCVNSWTSFHTLSSWMVFYWYEFFLLRLQMLWLTELLLTL